MLIQADISQAEITDDDLFRRYLSAGDRDALAELIRRYMPMVYAAARRQVRDAVLAEDVMQEVLITFARRAGEIRSSAALGGWLMRTTRFTVANAMRTESRRRHLEQAASAEGSRSPEIADPANEAIDAEQERCWQMIRPELDEAISRLSGADQSAVALRYFRGMSLREVAAATGSTEEAARKRLSRAIGKLRKKLGGSRAAAAVAGIDLAAMLARRGVEPVPADLAMHIAAATGAAASGAKVAGGSILYAASSMSAGAKIAAGVALAIIAAAGTAGAIKVARVVVAGQVEAPVQAPARDAGTPNAAAPDQQVPSPAPVVSDNPLVRFKEAYSLKPGENVKLMPPPFIPERAAMYREISGGDKAHPEGPDVLGFAQQANGTLKSQGYTIVGGDGDHVLGEPGLPLWDLTVQLAGLWSWQIQGDIPLLATPMPGDWIIRQGASREELLSGLAQIASDRTGQKLVFTQARPAMDVVVVSGIAKGHRIRNGGYRSAVDVNVKIPNARLPSTGSPTMDAAASLLGGLIAPFSRSHSTGPIGAMINSLSFASGVRFLNESADAPGSVQFSTVIQPAADDGLSADQQLDTLLKTLAQQTGLKFTRDHRAVDIWTLAPEAQK